MTLNEEFVPYQYLFLLWTAEKHVSISFDYQKDEYYLSSKIFLFLLSNL